MALDRTWYNSLVDDSGDGMSGSVWDKADVDALMDAIDAEIARIDTKRLPNVEITRAAPHFHSNGVWEVVQWDTEYWDSSGFWDASAASNIVIPQTGLYLILATLVWAANVTGHRQIAIRVNGADIIPSPQVMGTSPAMTYLEFHRSVVLTAGDVLTVWAYQSSGAPLNMSPSFPNLNFLSIAYVSA